MEWVDAETFIAPLDEKVSMRVLLGTLISTLTLMLAPATNAHAFAQSTESQVNSELIDHYAIVATPTEVWENGSRGGASIRVGYPADDLTLRLRWGGIVYDDAGNELVRGSEYDVHAEVDPALFVEKFRLHGLKTARFRWVQLDACTVWGRGCIESHTVIFDVRWKGYGQ
jgi:hypothetical protein